MRPKRVRVVPAVFVLALCVVARAQETVKQVTWRFDDTASLGGHATKVLGHPQVIEMPMGKAIAFNGVDDALFVNVHPLAGGERWTWEMAFKPDGGGGGEERILHRQPIVPANGGGFPEEGLVFQHGVVDGP